MFKTLATIKRKDYVKGIISIIKKIKPSKKGFKEAFQTLGYARHI